MAQQPYSSQEGVEEEGVVQEGSADASGGAPPPVPSGGPLRIRLVTPMYDRSRIISRKGI